MTSEPRKRRIIHNQAREMIAKVYHFLREEYDFLKQNNFDNCDLTPLANVRKRTAEATGVSERTVSQVLKEERESTTTDASKPKQIKKEKKQMPIKKKLQKNDEKKVQPPSLEIHTTKTLELNLKSEIPFTEPVLTNPDYGSTLFNTENNWQTCFKTEP